MIAHSSDVCSCARAMRRKYNSSLWPRPDQIALIAFSRNSVFAPACHPYQGQLGGDWVSVGTWKDKHMRSFATPEYCAKAWNLIWRTTLRSHGSFIIKTSLPDPRNLLEYHRSRSGLRRIPQSIQYWYNIGRHPPKLQIPCD